MVGQFGGQLGVREPVGIEVGFDEGGCLFPYRIVVAHENNATPHEGSTRAPRGLSQAWRLPRQSRSRRWPKRRSSVHPFFPASSSWTSSPATVQADGATSLETNKSFLERLLIISPACFRAIKPTRTVARKAPKMEFGASADCRPISPSIGIPCSVIIQSRSPERPQIGRPLDGVQYIHGHQAGFDRNCRNARRHAQRAFADSRLYSISAITVVNDAAAPSPNGNLVGRFGQARRC
jgi:hypothetical protein